MTADELKTVECENCHKTGELDITTQCAPIGWFHIMQQFDPIPDTSNIGDWFYCNIGCIAAAIRKAAIV